MTYTQGYQSSPGMSVSVRPMTDAERQAVKTIPRPLRANAIGMSLVSMVMAIMINFVDNPVAVFMPLLFGFVGLGYAIQARKSSGSVAQAVAKGTVTEVRVTPRWMGARGWQVGTFSIARSKHARGPAGRRRAGDCRHRPRGEARRVREHDARSGSRSRSIAPAGFENTLVVVPRRLQAGPVAGADGPGPGCASASGGVGADVLSTVRQGRLGRCDVLREVRVQAEAVSQGQWPGLAHVMSAMRQP